MLRAPIPPPYAYSGPPEAASGSRLRRRVENPYRGGPAVRVTLPFLRWPDGVTQVTGTVLPGWNFDSAACRESGAATALPVTPVTTDPAAIPAVVAAGAQTGRVCTRA